jgi:hypothetical protein
VVELLREKYGREFREDRHGPDWPISRVLRPSLRAGEKKALPEQRLECGRVSEIVWWQIYGRQAHE